MPVGLDGHQQVPLAQSSCGEWLVFERLDGALTLVSPFSAAGATMVLPGLHTLYASHKPGMQMQGPTIRKLVVCSDDLVAAMVVQEETGDVELAFCRPRASSWSWRSYNIFEDLQDIIVYKAQLYALTMDRALFSVSVSKRSVTGELVVRRVIANPVKHPLFKAAPPSYLLESNGKLLLIYRRGALDGKKRKRKRLPCEESETATKFVVFVAEFERLRWKRAGCNTELRQAVPDDQVLFLGPWCSRSVAIPQGQDHRDKSYMDMGGNSIVFLSDDGHGIGTADRERKRVAFCCSVYDVKTRRSQSLLQTSVQPLEGFQATWLFPPIQSAQLA